MKVGEGQPGAHVVGQGGLAIGVVGHVLEGGGGGHDDGRAVGQGAAQGLQDGQGGAQVGAPNVAAGDDPGDDGLAAQAGQVGGGRQLPRDQVEPDRLHAGAGQDRQGVAERAVGADLIKLSLFGKWILRIGSVSIEPED